MIYTPENWYWVVDGDTTQVYSSAERDFVSVDDSNYEAWLATGHVPTPISADDMILLRISFLEASVTERRRREAILNSTGKAWLADVDAQITALRSQLST